MADTVLILAAGEHKRFGKKCKHLMPVGNETVIARTVRMCEERDHTPVVVTHRACIAEVALNVHAPAAHDTLLDTIQSTRELWRGRVALLLGDVVFSDLALDTALNPPHVPAVVGDTTENFALTFDPEHYADVLRWAEEGKAGGGSKLWDLYEAMVGTVTNRYIVVSPPYVVVDDWTTDIDTMHEYNNLIARLRREGKVHA